jgi:hypothetical protein
MALIATWFSLHDLADINFSVFLGNIPHAENIWPTYDYFGEGKEKFLAESDNFSLRGGQLC